MILQTLRAQLHEPPDTKIRYLLIAMAGFIPYLVLDWSYAHTSQKITDIEDERKLVQGEVTTSNAMISQIPLLQENIKDLQSKINTIQSENKAFDAELTKCRENNILTMLRQIPDEKSPFAGFTVQTNDNVYGYTESVYQIQLKGIYENILNGMRLIDESLCSQHVKLWDLKISGEDNLLLTGSIQLSVYKQKEDSE